MDFRILQTSADTAMVRTAFSGLAALVLLLPSDALGQGVDTTATVSEACRRPAFRAFDFWIGRWVVRDSTGQQVGRSRIVRIARGCGIREEWAGRSGSRGTSLNYYDPDSDQWHQDWVGSSGRILHLTGGIRDSAMVLEGQRNRESGVVWDRIVWRQLDDGRVRQEWTVSSDGRETWSRVFLGFYEPSGATSQ